ncbi:MAG TPA: hypothetical protein VKU85_11985, partial [bacterium]|nr:hypothetical protein [bacterium]
ALANVNRWREQMSLPPVGEAELGSMLTRVDVDGHATDLVRIVSDEEDPAGQETLAAILRTPDRVWFFMTMGSRAQVGPYEDDFRTFLEGVRMEGPAPAPAEAPDLAATDGGTPLLSWTLPDGWEEVPSSSSMRLATFRVGEGDNASEVAITRFPGQVGGLLANVNRWRDQLDLAPVADLSEQDQTAVSVAGSPGMLLDLAGAGASGDDERILVVLVPRGDFTWFLKMTGTYERLERERGGFESFVQSVTLPEAS